MQSISQQRYPPGINIYGYSVVIGNEYDITSMKDVVKTLKWINHEDTSEKYAKSFQS